MAEAAFKNFEMLRGPPVSELAQGERAVELEPRLLGQAARSMRRPVT